jgi:hypothetical protein
MDAVYARGGLAMRGTMGGGPTIAGFGGLCIRGAIGGFCGSSGRCSFGSANSRLLLHAADFLLLILLPVILVVSPGIVLCQEAFLLEVTAAGPPVRALIVEEAYAQPREHTQSR